jgi:peptide chain release factor 3
MESHGGLVHQVEARRTFAIISHPDAGKTTLTEKILFYGGAIHLAGSVKQRSAAARAATSDWMEIERQRGISVTTSVLHFEYGGRRVNLLDTPGHNDFSEDTYRTLAAVDSAVMLIDAMKGIEPQTTKLFAVCRMRNVPIATFINKLDRHGRPALELIDEIEQTLGIPCSPMNWPVGAGPEFLGVFDRRLRKVLRFERSARGEPRAEPRVLELDDPEIRSVLGDRRYAELCEELALLDAAGRPFDAGAFHAGQLSPVFFGSAITDAGVKPFLDWFVEHAPAPRPRATAQSEVQPADHGFSGFVFKIQANMDPAHRDRVAFLRVCSGRFQRGMLAYHARTGKRINLTRSLLFLAQERTLVEEAYAGDIVGIWDGGVLRLGDTVAEDPGLHFEGMPRFSPEHFVCARLEDPLRRKQLKKGLEQLSEEGAVQLFFDRRRMERDPILGAVGRLQFDVIQHRLQGEYGVRVRLEPLPFACARWLEGGPFDPETFERGERSTCILDVEGRPLVLFHDVWGLQYAEKNHPELRFVAAVQPSRSSRSAA